MKNKFIFDCSYSAKNKSNGKSINGIIEAFPKELIGVVPVKQYLEAVGIINYNGVKKFKKLSKKHCYIVMFFIFPLLILFIVDFFRWFSFKKKVQCDLAPNIENINKTMLMIDVLFQIEISVFGNIKLKVLYDKTSNYAKELMPDKKIEIEGFKEQILLLEPSSSRLPTIESLNCCNNKRKKSMWDFRVKRDDQNDIKLIIKSKYIGIFNRDIRGWSDHYYNQLYNFISVKEFNEMIEDYNSLREYDTFNTVCLVVYISTAFLSITIIGLAIWGITWEYYAKEHIRYSNSIRSQRQNLNAKYNSLYGSRGFRICDDPVVRGESTLIVKDSKGSRAYTTRSNRVDLFIYVSRDVGDGPVLTTLLPSKKLILAPTIPNGINPKYIVNDGQY